MGTLITKEKLFSKKWFRAYGFILLGTFIMAAGYVLFVTPHKIIPGGIYGITIVLHHLFETPVGLMALLFNIPLTILGTKILGPRFGIKTVVGFLLTAGFLDLLNWLSGGIPLVKEDPLLSAIFGATLIGIGVAFLFKAKAACGGTDAVAMILGKYTRLPLGQLMIMVDSCIVILGVIVFGDWKIPLYSWLVIFIMGKVIDIVLQGVSYDKTLFIISDKYQEISTKIKNDIRRGGTLISAKGMYKNTEKEIIFTVLTRREVEILKDFIKGIDPNAFVTVLDSSEILGEGFKKLNQED